MPGGRRRTASLPTRPLHIEHLRQCSPQRTLTSSPSQHARPSTFSLFPFVPRCIVGWRFIKKFVGTKKNNDDAGRAFAWLCDSPTAMPLASGCGIVCLVSQPKIARDARVDFTSGSADGLTTPRAVTQGLLATVYGAWAPGWSSAGRHCAPPLAFHASFPGAASPPHRRRAGASARSRRAQACRSPHDALSHEFSQRHAHARIQSHIYASCCRV